MDVDSLPEPAIEALVRAAQAGDGVAMAELLLRLEPIVGRICGAIALEQGADAAQEALLQVLRDIGQLRDPARLVAWARRIAAREAVRMARRQREQAPSSLEPGVLPAAGDPELAASVRSVLARLAPEQRAILALRDLEGLSEEEAAAELGVAKGTVKSRLHRARAAFLERWTS